MAVLAWLDHSLAHARERNQPRLIRLLEAVRVEEGFEMAPRMASRTVRQRDI